MAGSWTSHTQQLSYWHNDEEQRSEAGSCSTVPDGYCAVLYDDEDCRGWSFEVPSGSYDLPEDLRNDAEVVVVRAGCKFTGMYNL